MDSVAEPAPALASTTSVPASWMRFVRASIFESSKVTFGVVCRQQLRPVVSVIALHRQSVTVNSYQSYRCSLNNQKVYEQVAAVSMMPPEVTSEQHAPATGAAGWWCRRGHR